MSEIDLFVDETGRIARNPLYRFGDAATVNGRISVGVIASRVAAGDSVEETAADYRIDVEDVRAAVAYKYKGPETKFMNRLVREYYRSKDVLAAASPLREPDAP